MITLTAEIQFAKNSKISSVTSNYNSNTSTQIADVINEAKTETPYRGIVNSNLNGEFPAPYELNVSGENLRRIYISFDVINNEYPQNISLVKKSTKNEVFIDTISVVAQFDGSGAYSGTIKAEDYELVGFDNVDVESVEVFIDEIGTITPIGEQFTYEITNKTGKFGDIEFTINFENAEYNSKSFRISMDVTGRKITSVIDTIKEYKNNSPVCILDDLPVGETNYIFQIHDWIGEKRSPVVIYGIFSNIKINLDYKSLISLETKTTDRSDVEFPSWGIISNGGSLTFIDRDETIIEFANLGLIDNKFICEIYLNNTSKKITRLCGTFNVENLEYDNDNKQVNVSFSDSLMEWQTINAERVPLLAPGITVNSIYEHLVDKTVSVTDLTKESFVIDDDTMSFISSISAYEAYIESGSLWSQWNKFCQFCALNIYKNDENKIVISHDFRS